MSMLPQIRILAVAALIWGVAIPGSAEPPPLPAASADDLPVWRGFNLQSKFALEWSNGPFREKDFQLIAELGFNFVRLPMDYRVWIEDGDWRKINENVIREIDQAVAWGKKYGIHVCINFHRAPGHTVAEPRESHNLWTDPEAQEVCALHWAYFAKRYKDIPNSRLSFNLFNEPEEISCETYAPVVKRMVEAIRAEDPDRLIIADGTYWGRKPCPELADLGIAQATRGYDPIGVTHYQASWVHTPLTSEPRWPMPLTNRFLFGPNKGDLRAPIRLKGPFPEGIRLRLRVGTVSIRGHLVVAADGDIVWDHEFVCGPGEGEWKEAIWKEEWQAYQNRYDKDYLIEIPAGTETATLKNTGGDWMSITEIGVRTLDNPDGPEATLAMLPSWGATNPTIHVNPAEDRWTFRADKMHDQDALWEELIQPWRAIERQGVGVVVGEWGAYNKTPHDLTLRWMEDCLQNWQKAGWGWALWNFRGPFGILDSERSDVDYEDWRGHKLDRAMLELLRRY